MLSELNSTGKGARVKGFEAIKVGQAGPLLYNLPHHSKHLVLESLHL